MEKNHRSQTMNESTEPCGNGQYDPLHNITPNDHVGITIHLGINNNPPLHIATKLIKPGNEKTTWQHIAEALHETANWIEDTNK